MSLYLKSNSFTRVFLRCLNHSPQYSVNPDSVFFFTYGSFLGFSIKYYTDLLFQVSSLETLVMVTVILLCLPSLSITSSLNYFTSFLIWFSFSWLFTCFASLLFIKFLFLISFYFFILFLSWVPVIYVSFFLFLSICVPSFYILDLRWAVFFCFSYPWILCDDIKSHLEWHVNVFFTFMAHWGGEFSSAEEFYSHIWLSAVTLCRCGMQFFGHIHCTDSF